MTRRTRLASSVLALALAVTLLPASAGSAQSGTPLRPAVRDQPDPNPGVVLRGRGWGHSVGMSQYGAYAMSRARWSHGRILQHYYPGVTERTWAGSPVVRVRLADVRTDLTETAVRAVGGPLTWRTDAANVTQPEGTSWTVRAVGTNEVRLADGTTTKASSSLLRVVLSPHDTTRPEPSPTRLATYNPVGLREYAYGRTTFTAAVDANDRSRLVINQDLPIEGYMRGLNEVSASWGTNQNGGFNALKAQAIAARTYMLRSGTGGATPSFQVYTGYAKELEAGGLWRQAVDATALRYLNEANTTSPALAVYSSSHGGRTESAQDSWAFRSAVPYLVSVDDPWSLDPVNPMRSWTAVASNAEFRRVTGLGLSRIERVEIMSRTAGGSPRVLRVTGPEGTREFSTTASAAQSRSCNRTGYAGNSLRCDLATTVRNAAGAPFAPAGGRPPSSQIRSIGFAPFTDDDGNTHEYSIVWANAAGIANGKDATTFAPRESVTRGQMAAFIYRTFDIPKRTDHTFTDARGSTHEEAIASVAAAGIANGYDARRFGPSDLVTRAQMASFIARAMGLSPTPPTFDDVPRDGTHAGNIGAIAERGVTAGCRGNSYCPNDPVGRDQMTTFLHRAARSLR